MKKANLIMFIAYVGVFICLLLFSSCIPAPIKVKERYIPLNEAMQEEAEDRVKLKNGYY